MTGARLTLEQTHPILGRPWSIEHSWEPNWGLPGAALRTAVL